MKMIIKSGKPLRGTVQIPGDKSISHRAILFSALAEGRSQINNLLIAGVTENMLDALPGLGVQWTLKGTQLTVRSPGLDGWKPPLEPLDCGHSATTLRLLAGACAAAGIPVLLDGSESLRTRPMARIVDPLWEMGVPIQALGEGGTAPLQLGSILTDQTFQALNYRAPVASAQVKSCLLLAGLRAQGALTYTEPSPSRDHTERMLSQQGVDIQREELPDGQIRVTMEPLGEHHLLPLDLTIPGDLSSASFLITAALITPGSDLTLPSVGLNPTRTGMLDALREMGARIEIRNRKQIHGEPIGDLQVQHSRLKGILLENPQVVRMIDELPIFAVAAACAEGKTAVRDAGELRLKESDRIAALCRELNVLGVNIEEHRDGFTIQGGGPLQGGRVRPGKDHRMAMALAVAGMNAANPVIVEGAEIISESFPSFSRELTKLGGLIIKEEK